MTAMRKVLLIAILLGPSVTIAADQTSRPVFRAGVDVVQIDVSVLDGRRQPVKGLTAADFTVLEDGVARPVRALAEVTVPPRATPAAGDAVWATSVPPDVVTNDVGREDGRLVIILMDRTIPPGEPTITAKRIATAAVDALGPHDLAALVSTSGGVPQTFTSDRARLERAIAQRDWSTDVSQEAKDILSSLSGDLAPDSLSDGRCLCGLCVLDTITRLADAVRDAPGRRKSLFFIGSSLVVQSGARDPKADVGCDRLLKDSRTRMLDALDRSSLTVHSIDPTGLVSIGPQTRASTPNGIPPAVLLQMQQNETNDLLAHQEQLRMLPARTGGRRVINTNAPQDAVPDIFGETASYYLLAYEPDAARRGATRSLEVNVARKGVSVFTQHRVDASMAAPQPRTGGPAAAPATSMDDALRGLLPQASRPLALSLTAMAGPVDRPLVNVLLDVRSLVDAGRTSAFEIGVVAIDAVANTVATGHQTVTVSLDAAARTLPAEIPVKSRLELAPGDYEIRVAVQNTTTGAVSSVFAPIAIPSFGDAPLSLSDVALETSASGAGPSSPTLRRAFTHADHLHVSGFVYEGLTRDDAIVPAAIHVRVLDAAGRAVHDQALTIVEHDFARRRAACQVAVPLDSLAAGSYLLRVDAAAGRATASRAVPFTIE